MNFNFTVNHLNLLIPGNTQVSAWYTALCDILPKYDITTRNRVAHFISQCAHESNNFRNLEENLNYSEEALNRVFPRYFGKGKRNAAEYAHNPEKIANYVYMDQYRSKSGALGNTQPGDGWRFRGRGLKQLTGRSNYLRFGQTIGISAEEAAEYVSTEKGAVESACWFWNSNRLNDIADTNNVARLTQRINGGNIGLADRQKRFASAIRVLTEERPIPQQLLEILRVGSRGDSVKIIQNKLNIPSDGIFGPATERAVKTWQSANGLVADGVVGPATFSKMFT